MLASLSAKTGDIQWRRIFESEKSRGNIKFLYVNREARNVVSSRNEEADPFGIVTVTGDHPVSFRGWDINTGNLLWEWSLVPVGDNTDGTYFFKDSYIYHVIPVWGSHLEVTEYHASTGQQRTSKSSRISAGWISREKCVFTSSYFTCLVKDQLLVLDILATDNNVRTKAIQDSSSALTVVKGTEGFVQVGRLVISLNDLQVVLENRNNANVFMDERLYQLTQSGKDVKISAESQELSSITDIPETLDNNLHIVASKCKSKRDAANQLVCRFLLSTDDGAITMVQQGKFKWIREEALAQIVAVEFLDLTLSDAQGAIEEELNNKDGE